MDRRQKEASFPEVHGVWETPGKWRGKESVSNQLKICCITEKQIRSCGGKVFEIKAMCTGM